MTVVPDFMAAVFSGITAIEEGKVAEIQVDYRVTTSDDVEIVLSFEARREVRNFSEAP